MTYARRYSRWDVVRTTDPWSGAPIDGPTISTVFYTPSVVNTPGSISSEIKRARETLRDLAKRPLRLEKEERLAFIRKRDQEHQETILYKHDWRDPPLSEP